MVVVGSSAIFDTSRDLDHNLKAKGKAGWVWALSCAVCHGETEAHLRNSAPRWAITTANICFAFATSVTREVCDFLVTSRFDHTRNCYVMPDCVVSHL